jgi:hypothetical protein
MLLMLAISAIITVFYNSGRKKGLQVSDRISHWYDNLPFISALRNKENRAKKDLSDFAKKGC